MSSSRIRRKTAFQTVVDAFGIATDYPLLLGAFLLVAVVEAFAEVGGPLLSILGTVIGLYVGGIAYLYTESELVGSTVSFGDAAERVLPRLLSLVGILIVYVVAVGIGIVLLVLPGIYLGARLILAFPACVVDDQGAFESLATSWDAAGGNVLKLVGIFLLLMVGALGTTALGAAFGGLEFVDSPMYLLVTAPISAILTATIEIATARVYLENTVPADDPRLQQTTTGAGGRSGPTSTASDSRSLR